jgi:hypothetical protein
VSNVIHILGDIGTVVSSLTGIGIGVGGAIFLFKMTRAIKASPEDVPADAGDEVDVYADLEVPPTLPSRSVDAPEFERVTRREGIRRAPAVQTHRALDGACA